MSKLIGTSDELKRLQEWYLRECNGDWEHSFGVTIETLDNPGWIVKVDLSETAWENLDVALQVTKRSDSDWVQIEIKDSRFTGCGGAHNLAEVIGEFLNLVDDNG